MTKVKLILAMAACLMMGSCTIINSFKHDDAVVAKVNGHKLYASELEKYIPDGINPEDSTKLAQQYIKSWATDLLYVSTAEEELSKDEKNLDKEIEEYRNSLLKYRYEQSYINNHLDTVITASQLKTYYDEHQELFELPRPIMKLRYLDIMKESPNREEILDKISSESGLEKQEFDSLAFASALKYLDNTNNWMDAALLAREFGLDIPTMLSKLKDKLITYEPEGSGDLRIAYIFEIQKDGVAPMEYCIPTIRENILSERKRDLLLVLEQELLTKAQESKDLVIY